MPNAIRGTLPVGKARKLLDKYNLRFEEQGNEILVHYHGQSYGLTVDENAKVRKARWEGMFKHFRLRH